MVCNTDGGGDYEKTLDAVKIIQARETGVSEWRQVGGVKKV